MSFFNDHMDNRAQRLSVLESSIIGLYSDRIDKPCIGSRELSILESSIYVLKSTGGDIRAGSDEIWVNPSNLLNYSADDVGSRLEGIKALESTRQTLFALARNLKSTIVNRRKVLLHRGLALLPHEVFLRIFRHLLHSEDDLKRIRLALDIIRDMSLVCRYFRQIVLAFTEVWSYIDLDRLGYEDVELFLLRSKKEPLSVTFLFDNEFEENLLRLLEHKDRWTYLHAKFDYYGGELKKRYPRIVFPLVRKVHLHVGPNMFYPDQYFDYWSFPCAEHVELSGWLPVEDSIFNRDIVRTIKYYSVSERFDEEGDFLTRLSLFLYAPISVQTLDLDVSGIRRATNRGESPAVDLPDVTTLRITNCKTLSAYNRFDPMTLDSFEEILALLKLPNVKNVSVSLAFSEDDFDLVEFLDYAFPPENGLRSVSELAFNVMYLRNARKGPRLSLSLDAFFQRFPALQVLSLDASLCDICCSESNDFPMEGLRTFCLENYDGYMSRLYHVLDVLHSRGVNLQDFILAAKRIPDSTALRKAIPEGNIRVKCRLLAL